MIKLIQNELIKIFKRKSIYFLLFITFVAVIIYNYINPDQNEAIPILNSTEDVNISSIEKTLENIQKNTEYYISQKSSIDFFKLYNKYEKKSWQRYALNEERSYRTIQNTDLNYQLDIEDLYLKKINDYELNAETKVTVEEYQKSKNKYNEYVQALDSDNWKNFVNLKIRNLEERKQTEKYTDEEIDIVNFEIECYKLRLDNNITFGHDELNQYLGEYKENYYMYKFYEKMPYNESEQYINKNKNEYKAKIAICKYAIENNISHDISNERTLISENKIDARISFIRTFKHFDLIIVIIAIYLATTIVTEEINKKTAKTLLTKPHKRSAILISKIVACIIAIIISIIFLIIFQYIVGGIIFGFNSYKLDYIGYDFHNNQILIISLVKYIILVAITKLPMYIIVISFCILIGTLNKHTSMSMILTLIIFIISSTVLSEWSEVEALSTITRYFITNNWDFSTYLFGQISDIAGVNLFNSIVIYIIYFCLLVFLSIHVFNKKEINNV